MTPARRALLVPVLLASACLARFEVGEPGENEATDASAGETRGSASTSGEAGNEDAGGSDTSETQTEGESDDPQDCGQACDPLAEICVEGSCACRPGFERCAGMCVSLDSDPLHCGSCSEGCEAQQVCEDGDCKPECGDGQAVDCSGACVELDSDPLHCGACEQACSGDELCVESACVGYVFADCESDLDCGAGVCCEGEVEGEGPGEMLCVDGDQCP